MIKQTIFLDVNDATIIIEVTTPTFFDGARIFKKQSVPMHKSTFQFEYTLPLRNGYICNR
jgi:hypothetical protein